MTVVKTFSDNIRTEVGLDKYATADLKHVKRNKNRNVSLNDQTYQTYKGLYIEEGKGIDNSQMKKKLVKNIIVGSFTHLTQS